MGSRAKIHRGSSWRPRLPRIFTQVIGAVLCILPLLGDSPTHTTSTIRNGDPEKLNRLGRPRQNRRRSCVSAGKSQRGRTVVAFRHTVLGGIEVFKARISQLVAATFSAAAIVMFSVPIGAQAATLVPATAEGDSYAVGAVVSLLGGAVGSPAFVGPVAPSTSTVPPGTTAENQ